MIRNRIWVKSVRLDLLKKLVIFFGTLSHFFGNLWKDIAKNKMETKFGGILLQYIATYGWNQGVCFLLIKWSYFWGLWVTFLATYEMIWQKKILYKILGRVKIYQSFDIIGPIYLSICLENISGLRMTRITLWASIW